MPYSNDDDLLNEFSLADLSRLTGNTNGTAINPVRTATARANADAIIDSYLHGRYATPFIGTINPLIRKLSVDLTVANLYDQVYSNSSVPSTVTWRKINAVKMLKDLQAGTVTLSTATAGTNAPPPLISNKSEGERLFGEDVLDCFTGS